MKGLMGAEAALTGAVGRLFALMESYPDLKANQNMMQLSEELTSTENRVAFARQAYNDAVTEYNTSREKFPNVLIASSMGFAAARALRDRGGVRARRPEGGFLEGCLVDFFQHQDEARRASRNLVVYFALAVAATAASVYLAASFLFFWVESSRYRDFTWWDLDRFVLFAGGALLVIVTGSAYKIWRLSDGGHAVAALLGGRPVDPNTGDPKKRRVLNVVEEMAIASGIPVPTVYLLESEDRHQRLRCRLHSPGRRHRRHPGHARVC